VSWVEASRHADGTAYAAFDRHTLGDMSPHVYKTTDFGRTWQQLMGPATPGVRGYAHVVREDLVSPNILYVGTEFGLFISIDGGKQWAAFKPGDFPAVAVRDIALQSRDHDVVLGTHGRGIWIIDDVTPLRALSAEVLGADAALLAGRPIQQRIQGNGGWSEGDAKFRGANPPDGAVITYYQKSRHVIGRLKLEVLDAAGNVVETLPASKRKGLNRVEWSMRTKPPVVPPAATLAFFGTRGPRMMPGNYTVRLTKAGKTYEMPLVIGLDRRATFSVDERKLQYDAAMRVHGLFGRMSELVAKLNAVRGQAAAIAAKLPAKDPVRVQLERLAEDADAIRKKIVATKEGGAITGEERLREHMDSVYGAVTSVESAPTRYALERIDVLERELGEVEAQFKTLADGKLAPLNKTLEGKQLPAISLANVRIDASDARGGPASAVLGGMVGGRFVGSLPTMARSKQRRLY
jgi:hypothetical protein